VTVARNQPCLCGSGRKAKKCCAFTVGCDVTFARRMVAWVADHLAFFERQPGYRPPEQGDWETA
jgi:hypothetical protein